jgi:hypothetical protein
MCVANHCAITVIKLRTIFLFIEISPSSREDELRILVKQLKIKTKSCKNRSKRTMSIVYLKLKP